ncbi:hypothetical protein [Methylobacterium isbiliense]|jgi:hypothetical protein|uniref:DUF4148 domain-containing protein n=1 Tax=Methylobacterium isbiliense TaxID=315478 RepID=A0ABQ4SJY5_9HYPH|nr:hypothetical protein [Methylobacterium isbiliense]MDN3624927.1 hypothetical protein [Methylobacterium isbiliense]GJE03521.1 hypothetical protein GMJLKIPL_5478 [Methylobacterium isbiliense]
MGDNMTKSILLLAGAMTLAATAASAQTAKENYSYKAPSGMFSEGTTKWEMYRFMAEDAERRAGLANGPAAAPAVAPGAATRYTGTARPRR